MRISLALLFALAACAGETGDDAAPAPTTYGPDNSWWHADAEAVPADLAGTGRRVGDVAPNFTLVDQFGDEVELYQFYGQVVVLDVLALWCEPCQEVAPDNQVFWAEQQAVDAPFTMIAIVTDGYGPVPVDGDAKEWADAFALTHPVVADPSRDETAWLDTAYPTAVLLDHEMRVVAEALPYGEHAQIADQISEIP